MNKKTKFIKKAAALICTILIFSVMTVPAFAAETAASGDPLMVIDNLNSVIFGVIKGIGIGFTGFGFFQIGTSIPSHDSGQRAIGIASAVGGLIMIFAKQILVFIGAV